jgi:hypothetical protein
MDKLPILCLWNCPRKWDRARFVCPTIGEQFRRRQFSSFNFAHNFSHYLYSRSLVYPNNQTNNTKTNDEVSNAKTNDEVSNTKTNGKAANTQTNTQTDTQTDKETNSDDF